MAEKIINIEKGEKNELPVNYSQTEHIVGTWIDGKPLYEKTVVDTMPTVATDGTYVVKDIAHLVSNMALGFIHNAFIVNDTGDSGYSYPMTYLINSGYQAKARVRPNNIQLSSGYKGWNGMYTYVTIRYTKTTDSVSV